MKHYYVKKIQPQKVLTIPERIVMIHEKTTCDICGKEALNGYWESFFYEVNKTEVEVTVKQKDGTEYQEEGSGTNFRADICPTCFKEKVITVLFQSDARPNGLIGTDKI